MNEDNYWDNQDYEDYSAGSGTFEDQTAQNNGGDYSTGSDYTGYTPGYNNPNLDTSYSNNDWNSGYNYQPNGQVQSTPDILQTPQWFSGNPNTMGGTGAPLATSPSLQIPAYTSATNPMAAAAPQSNFGTYANGISQVLASLFGNTNNNRVAGTLASAVASGAQNKQQAAALNQIASNPALDPFGQANRQFYQQQAQSAVTNPYDSPIVKAQIEQLQRAQSIKDAAAGRRSNSLTSDPAVMAEMAKIAMQYQSQMANQGGAQFAPQGQAIAALQSQAAAKKSDGYVSPLINAFNNLNTSVVPSSNRQTALEKFFSDNS